MVNWKLCEIKLSRKIWWNMTIRPNDRGWCHDLIWCDILKWTDDIWWSLDQIYIAIFIRNYLTGIFHDQFEVLCGLEEMRDDDVMT
jgi:hypothetical protein